MAFTADIIQDTLQGVFLFTNVGVILLTLKLFRSCRIIHARELYYYESNIPNGSDLTLVDNQDHSAVREQT